MREVLGRWLLLRPGEGRRTAYFLLLNVLLGIGMAIGRASSEALFFNRVGVDQLPRFYILLSVVLLLASVIYAAFVDRMSAERLMRGFSITLLLLLISTGGLIQLFDGSPTYYGYFLLYELVSEILIIHMAHYLAQNLDLGQGKRLMPTILAGNQIGIIAGSLVVAAFSPVLPTVAFVYLWSGAVVLGLTLLHGWHRRMGRSPYFYPKPQRQASLKRTLQEIGQGTRALWTIPLARAGAVSLFLLVIAFYLLNFAVNKVYVDLYPDEQSLVAFFGWLNAGLSLTAIITQLVFSNRVIHWLGIKRVSLLYPIGNLVSFFALLVSFSLLPALLGSITRGVLMPAFHSPSSNLIYSIISRRMLGRVQAAMLGLVMPLALILCGVVLDWLIKHYPFEVVLWLGVAASLLYLGSTLWRSRCYHHELVSSLKDKIFLRKIGDQGARPDHDIMALMMGRISKEDDSALFFAGMMARYEPVAVAKKIDEIIPHTTIPQRDRLLTLAIEHRLKLNSALLDEMLNSGDEHLQATILRLLSVNGDEQADSLARATLNHQNPRLQAEAIRHLIAQPRYAASVVTVWQMMFNMNKREHDLALATLADQVAQLSPLAQMVEAYQQLFAKMLQTDDERSLTIALEALDQWPFPLAGEHLPSLERYLHSEDTALRQRAYKCLPLLPHEQAVTAAWRGLEDSQLPIRRSSLAFLEQHSGLSPEEVVQHLSGEGIGHPRQVMSLLNYVEGKAMPRHAYEAISEGLLTTAERFAAAAAWVSDHETTTSSRREILLHTLQERYNQMLDAALAALQGSENREELRIVRAILASGDTSSRARAGEVIGHIQNRELGRRLMGLIEQTGNFNDCMQRYRSLFSSHDEAKQWCHARNDRWLTELVTG